MILVLGGTTEGRELTQKLIEEGYPCLLSVVTNYGKELIGSLPIEIQVGALDKLSLERLLSEKKVKIIIDATHPYAEEIKKIAVEAAEEAGIDYLRYEREPLPLPVDPNIIVVEDYPAALDMLKMNQSGVFFSIGVRNLHYFKALWVEGSHPVWVKTYPDSKSLEICLQLGLKHEQIFAFHGAGNKELLKAMLNLTGAEWIVTKESGHLGGTDIKIAAGLDLGKKILIVKRPEIQSNIVFKRYEELLEYIKKPNL